MQQRRALVSVSDKTRLDYLVGALVGFGYEIISTGGTATAIRGFGLPVTMVEQVTGFPEMMNGRLKTLHPKVHGGILVLRGNSEHEASAQAHGIVPIDVVAVNLYPFATAIAKPGVTFSEAIEQIDIGGPAMLRSAAKNHEWVTAICDQDDYPAVVASLGWNGGVAPAGLRRSLAAKAFKHTAEYDRVIGEWLTAQSL